ncbi:alpha/beta hydrolase family protein [Leptospira ryugenii]|uniref:Alpha/beta hydrolase family protein n=1 Tax=Leptospira ryugenii TaxID=1917863 RepID=A0A2P2E1X9_9LEPT|nr:alpha/beta hydrolase [Leptospira ryugenii]GBF50870.1 alpha/beta hydrolase family protein [Leptospira ryugenii]
MNAKTFTFQGKKVAYYDSETANKPTVLICHANGYSAHCYRYYWEALKADYRVIGLDFIGHGKSESDLYFQNWYFFRDQILELIRVESLESVTLLGHSLGGASSLLAAEKNPHAIRKVIALDPVILGLKLITLAKIFGSPLARGAFKRRKTFNNLNLVRRAYQKFPAFAHWDGAIFEDYLNSCFRKTGNGEEVELCCDPKVEGRIFSHAHYTVFWKFKKIKVPSFILIPDPPEVCTPALARMITKGVKSSEFEIWTNCTHFFPFEIPEKTLSYILSKLKQ